MASAPFADLCSDSLLHWHPLPTVRPAQAFFSVHWAANWHSILKNVACSLRGRSHCCAASSCQRQVLQAQGCDITEVEIAAHYHDIEDTPPQRQASTS